MVHPCLSCGACCAFFRVSFHWTETSSESYGVPAALTTPISPVMDAMIGTGGVDPSCVALRGVIGIAASCSIYENRPGCCRLFEASFENGTESVDCAKARSGKGLRPLTKRDWPLTAAFAEE